MRVGTGNSLVICITRMEVANTRCRVPRDKMGNRIYMRRRAGGERSRDTVKKPSGSLRAIGTGEEEEERLPRSAIVYQSTRRHIPSASKFTVCDVLKCSQRAEGLCWSEDAGGGFIQTTRWRHRRHIFKQKAAKLIILTVKFGLPQGKLGDRPRSRPCCCRYTNICNKGTRNGSVKLF
jgi:hypothetical protein